MKHRLATNYAKNYCNRTPIVKVIVENVVTCFLGHSVDSLLSGSTVGYPSDSLASCLMYLPECVDLYKIAAYTY